MVKYLQSKRNDRGGWSNTQNTMMAMTALAEYGKLVGQNGKTDLTVEFTTKKTNEDDEEVSQNFTIDSENSGFVRQFDLKRGEKFTDVKISGNGCLLLQSTTKYNIESATEDKSLKIKFNRKKQEYCFKRKKNKSPTNMAILEVNHISGHVLDQEKFDQEIADSKKMRKLVKRYDNDRQSLKIYVDSVTWKNQCVTIPTKPAKGAPKVKNAQPRQIQLRSYYDEQVTRSILV